MELTRTRAPEKLRHTPSKGIARWTTAVAAAAVLALPFAASASADEHEAGDGTLTWGVKESFRNYVTGPIAGGDIATSDGATQTDSGEFEFSSGTGTVDDDGSASVAFSGAVNFTGHGGELDVVLGSPTLTLDGDGTGELAVEYTSPEGETDTVTIADLSGAELDVSGDTATLEGAEAALTAEGVAVFSYNGSGFYQEGEALDPVSANISLGEGGTDDPGTDDPGTDDPGTDDPGTDDPGTDDPGTDDPGTDDPGTDDPGTDDPATDDPATGPVIETDIV